MERLHAAAFERQRPWSAAEFSALTTSPHCFAIGDARAFALVRVIADEAELLTIAVHPDDRRQGRACALMRSWHAEAYARDATRALLEVAADNHAALGLYTACGYDQSGLRPRYYPRSDGPAVDALLLMRPLTRG